LLNYTGEDRAGSPWCDFLSSTWEAAMQETSYQQLVERLAQCEDLAMNAKDPSVREKASELARGYRDLIASARHHIKPDLRGLKALPTHKVAAACPISVP
jgi:hypothetical protein